MDVNEIRRIRIRELIDLEGSIAAFAEKIGSNPDYISSILSEKTKRNLGDDLARRIERKYGLPHGALDRSVGDELQEGIQALPEEQAQEVLDFIRYKFERAEGVIASEKAARYVKMIDGMIKDMQRRKAASVLPPPQPNGRVPPPATPLGGAKKKSAKKKKPE
jgi:transcriptional regulator with XRE-family HTH domain